MALEPSPFIDTAPHSSRREAVRASALIAAGDRSGSTLMGRVVATPVEEEGLLDGWVRCEVPAAAPTGTVTGPTDGALFAVGAVCLVHMDSAGKVTKIDSPLSLPDGAVPVATGETGRRVLAATAEAAEAVAQAHVAVEGAQAAQEHADTVAADLVVERDRVTAAVGRVGSLEGTVDGVESRVEAAEAGVASASAAAQAAQSDADEAKSAADAANSKATTLSGLVTVATRNPAKSDGTGKPTNAIWEVRSGSTLLRRYVWDGSTWTQVKAGQEFIGDNAIGRAQIADAAIGTAEIADAAVTNAKIGDLAVNKLTVAGGATIPQAVMNAVVSDKVFTDTLYTSRLSVSGGNIFPDPHFEDGNGWPGVMLIDADTYNSVTNKRYARINETAAQQQGVYYREGTRSIQMTPGATYHVKAKVFAGGTGAKAGMGAQITFRGKNSDGTDSYPNVKFTVTSAGRWQTFEADFTYFDTIVTGADVGLHSVGQYVVGAYVCVADIEVTKKVGAVLIEDGAITAQHINAESVASATADHIRLSTDQLYAGTAKIGGELIADTITGKTFNGATFNMDAGNGEYASISSSGLSYSIAGNIIGRTNWRGLVAPPYANIVWGTNLPNAPDHGTGALAEVSRAESKTLSNGMYVDNRYVRAPVSGWYMISGLTCWLWNSSQGDWSVGSGVAISTSTATSGPGVKIDWVNAPCAMSWLIPTITTMPSFSGLMHLDAGAGVTLGYWQNTNGPWSPNMYKQRLQIILIREG